MNQEEIMIRWLLGLSVLYISLCMGSGVGPRLRTDSWEETPPTTHYELRGEADEGMWSSNNVEEEGDDSTPRVRADVALLEELRTITELILRNQKEEKVPPPPPMVVHDCSTLRQAGVKVRTNSVS
ncbi:uncharacterized protein LOC122257944 [Penaeus japonicus]|uniref:uncharacterized protein LOC122257944 n=1 Tax=Penaeus japonicus TaxID=27405 RepID=UPI001C70D8EC|nr:uncharacterized protein LOC122257944 [Penaeus japonicus]